MPDAPTLTGGAPRVRTVALLGGVSLERDVPSEEVREYIRDPGNLVWVDVQDPGPEELSMLLEEFGFHPLALEDVARGQQRPKVEEYKGYLFVVTYGVVSGSQSWELQTREVDLFVGRNYLVSIHSGRVPALEHAFGRWTRSGAMLREGVGFLVYTVMDAVIDAYFPVLDAIEDEMDEIEMGMFSAFQEGSIQKLIELKKRLFMLRRVLYPMRDTYSTFLRRDQPLFAAGTLVYLHDVYNHILRILDVLDIERDRATGVLEAYLTVMSNRLNATMRTLTIASVGVGLAGAVFGMWGMNIRDVSLVVASPAFWGIVGGTLLLSVAALIVSRKRGWV